ncbi:hypothetical protein GCM10010912_30010 [Paenibacillus albidus]|uniref:Uncharacterized protein n=1 Tax=Paenibacillus albidus TaxID=2041023 RepID=A0A917FGF7_9BACL|nr:hypothetical protein GCM10010912_30010 [Paenibacillus albidus]
MDVVKTYLCIFFKMELKRTLKKSALFNHFNNANDASYAYK